MANWDIYPGEKKANTYAVTVTVYVKACTKKEAERFVLDKMQPEGGLGITAQKLTHNL